MWPNTKLQMDLKNKVFFEFLKRIVASGDMDTLDSFLFLYSLSVLTPEKAYAFVGPYSSGLSVCCSVFEPESLWERC